MPRFDLTFSGEQGGAFSINANPGDSHNCYLEELTTGTTVLVRRPGLHVLFTLPNSPVRGCYADSGISYWVAGTGVYKRALGNIITLLGTITTVNGHVNFASSGTDLILVDGVNGYNIVLATDVFSTISGGGFPANPTNINYLSSHFVVTSQSSDKFYVKLKTAPTWNALDFATTEGNPDNILSQKVLNDDLVLLGYKTIEIWNYTGNPDFPFQRNRGVVIDHGCIAENSPGKGGDSIYWVGGDNLGSGIVWRLNGYQAERISTHEIEQKIKAMVFIEDAFSVVYQYNGHIFYILQFPSERKTLCYDIITGLWHTLGYKDQSTGIEDIFKASCHCFSGSMNLVGDTGSGKVYQLSADFFDDDGNDIVMERTSAVNKKSQSYLFFKEFIVDLQAGVGNNLAPGDDPKIGLSWSDDGGHTWSNWRFTTMGKIGQYSARAYWDMLGAARNRVWKIRVTDRVKCVLIGEAVNAEEGIS